MFLTRLGFGSRPWSSPVTRRRSTSPAGRTAGSRWSRASSTASTTSCSAACTARTWWRHRLVGKMVDAYAQHDAVSTAAAQRSARGRRGRPVGATIEDRGRQRDRRRGRPRRAPRRPGAVRARPVAHPSAGRAVGAPSWTRRRSRSSTCIWMRRHPPTRLAWPTTLPTHSNSATSPPTHSGECMANHDPGEDQDVLLLPHPLQRTDLATGRTCRRRRRRRHPGGDAPLLPRRRGTAPEDAVLALRHRHALGAGGATPPAAQAGGSRPTCGR